MKKLIARLLLAMLDEATWAQAKADAMLSQIDRELIAAGCSPMDAGMRDCIRQHHLDLTQVDTWVVDTKLADLESLPSTSIHDHQTEA